MTPDAIDAIIKTVPEAVEIREALSEWPDELLQVPNVLTADLEDELFPISHPDEPDPLADTPDAELPESLVIEDAVRGREFGIAPDADEVALEIAGRLRERFGSGWPGAPGGNSIGPSGMPGPPHAGTQLSNPDVLAFYLPWHRFYLPQDRLWPHVWRVYPGSPGYQDLWGIYLLVEGIEGLGRDIHAIVPNLLSRAEGRRAAKLFLFHHEAYHNAVETFAARVEVSHRCPCYLTGADACAKTFLATSGLHEEGLANAYAVEVYI